jgi:hypothetical protein
VATAAALLEQLARRVARTSPQAPLSSRLLSAYVVMTGVDGGALSVGSTQAVRSSLAATDPIAERLEDLQELLREGPALEAVRTGVPVGLDGDGAPGRWPLLERSMHEGGTHTRIWLAAVPMRPASEVIGAITLYRLDSHGLALDRPDTTFLADAVGAAILGGLDRPDEAATSWGVRDRIDQATGMVMAQLHLQPRDARALLGAHAYASGTSLVAAADAVLARTLDFRDDDDDPDDADDERTT